MTLTDGVWELSDEHMLVFVIGHQVALLELPDVGMHWRCVSHQRLTYNKCQLSRALSSDIFFFELIGVSWGAKGPMIPHYTPLPSSSSSGFFLQGSEGACRRTPAGPLGGLG